MLLDAYGRTSYNLRVSVTSKCNLQCIFCHKEGNDTTNDTLTPKGIEKIVRVVSNYGVRKVKLTGGEPLIREDIVEIVKRIKSINRIQELSLVTNGSLLELLAEPLSRAGLDRVNINIPSLNEEKYHKITKGKLEYVLRSVRSAVENKLTPIKINFVLLRGLNDNELEDYIVYSKKENVQIQIIELEPIRIKKELFNEMHVKPDEIENMLERRANRSWVRESMQKRRVYDLDGAKIEIVHPIENTEFCKFCNRIRVTSNCRFKPCLMNDDYKIDVTDFVNLDDSLGISKAYLKTVMNRRPYFKSHSL